MDYTQYQGFGRNKVTGQVRPLSYLPNTSEWVGYILCLEADSGAYKPDQVLGGAEGISNAQAQALSNRTQFLRTNLSRLAAIVSAMQEALAPSLRAIKTLKITHTEPSDPDYSAWLDLEYTPETEAFLGTMVDPAAFDCKIYFDNGTYAQSPVLEITEQTGKTFFIRTDGTSILVESVEDQLDSDVF